MVALWLAGSLHDCGMLAGRGAAVDVEDGVVIGGDVIDALCPGDLVELATFALRHHDYIKDVFLGEVPAALVADELDTLDDTLRPVVLAVLGLVQVAGAASLGIGRLTAFRSRIFHGCIDGTASTIGRAASRLTRLLSPVPATSDVATGSDRVDANRAGLGPVERFLDRVPVHRWHRVLAKVDADQRLETLSALSAKWAPSTADRVVLMGPHLERPARVETALNGSRLLIVGV